jgi:glutaredoxin 3
MKARIYSTDWCGWCDSAKALLDQANLTYEEVFLNTDENIEQFKKDCPGLTSVPQIFIDGLYIGGYSDLVSYLENNI